MDWKRIEKLGKTLLFPPVALMIILIPIATVFLIYSMVFLGTKSIVAVMSYVLATYTLTIWCIKIPDLIRFFQSFKAENKYAQRWLQDARLRVKVSLYGSLSWNAAYAALQLGLGFWHHTFWFYSLAAYYAALAIMRFFLLRHTSKHEPGENMKAELMKYRVCGWVFLLMNLTLSVMVFFMIYWNRSFHHHEITTIALAAYTFTAFTMAVINIVKYRKYNSPVYSAAKAISLAAACVSMLTLEATMLTTFGGDTMDGFTRKLFLGLTGGAIAAFLIIMAIHMIVRSSKKLNRIKQ